MTPAIMDVRARRSLVRTSATRAEERPAPIAGPKLVAVCPKAWLKDLQPYVDLRRGSMNVAAVALEAVLAAETGADAPERLKRFLYREWRERGLRYVLLVGDADTLPVRFMVLDRKTKAAFNYAFYASDLYYALFGIDCLLALGLEPPPAVNSYLDRHGDGGGFDLVHLSCLTRSLIRLGAAGPRIEQLLDRLQGLAHPGGGFRTEESGEVSVLGAEGP